MTLIIFVRLEIVASLHDNLLVNRDSFLLN